MKNDSITASPPKQKGMFRVRVQGFNGAKAEFASMSAKLEQIVASELEAGAREWVAGAQRDAPVDQGTLKRLITYKPVGQFQHEIVSQAFYAPFIEFGTKGRYKPIPGTEAIAAQFRGYKGGDFMQLLRMIVRWVRRKGITGTYSVKTRRRTGNKINQFAEDYSAAWPIAMSILKNGIHPHPHFFKQAEVVWPKIIRNIERRLAKETKVAVIMPGGIRRPEIKTI